MEDVGGSLEAVLIPHICGQAPLARLRALGDGNQILTDLSKEGSVCQIGNV